MASRLEDHSKTEGNDPALELISKSEIMHHNEYYGSQQQA
jgi:hypothetical protein